MIFDIWLVPREEITGFAFQSRYPSAAVVPAAADDEAARQAWEAGGVLYQRPNLLVPVPEIHVAVLAEAVRRWAQRLYGTPVQVRLTGQTPRT